MTLRSEGAMAECETRTEEARIAALFARPMTQYRAGQCALAAKALFFSSLLGPGPRPILLGPSAFVLWPRRHLGLHRREDWVHPDGMADCLLGLDAGSRGVRCSVVPIDGGPVTSSARGWLPKAVPRAGFFAFDMDPAVCWRLLSETVREAMARAKVAPSHVLGMAASGMRFSLLLLDEDGHTLFAVPNQDARAAEHAIKLSDSQGPAFRRRTGHWPTPISMAPRLQFLATNAAALVTQAASALSLSDWIGYRLAGARLTSPSQAGATLLFDLDSGDWAWDLVDHLSIPRRLLPAVQESGTQLGGLIRPAAEALGLLAGTPVVMGGADTQCALLGTGAVAPGQVGIIAGSTTPVQLVTDWPGPRDESRLWNGHHCVPHRWVLETNAGPMGHTLEWFAATLYPGSNDGVARFMAEAARSDIGAD
ncbi:MAG: hypothetical protein A2W26_10530, partial [Acidobacteria bacterium RBG_16_64_8]